MTFLYRLSVSKMAAAWKNKIKLKEYNRRVHAAIVATADRRSQIMQDDARRTAPWTDRTGNARQGLFGTKEDEGLGKSVKIFLAHTMDYGLWLEVAHGGKYKIIWPTIAANLKPLLADLKAIFR